LFFWEEIQDVISSLTAEFITGVQEQDFAKFPDINGTTGGKQRGRNLHVYHLQNLFHISESHDTDCKARILILMVV
jgi:hypothetical protein